MGRKTFESIWDATKGKMLPNREIVFLTKRGTLSAVPAEDFKKMRAFNVDNLEEALDRKNRITEDLYVIGGASIFEQTMEKIDGIYLTKIHAHYEGDTFYPEIPTHFKEKSKEILQENPKIEVIFYENTRKK